MRLVGFCLAGLNPNGGCFHLRPVWCLNNGTTLTSKAALWRFLHTPLHRPWICWVLTHCLRSNRVESVFETSPLFRVMIKFALEIPDHLLLLVLPSLREAKSVLIVLSNRGGGKKRQLAATRISLRLFWYNHHDWPWNSEFEYWLSLALIETVEHQIKQQTKFKCFCTQWIKYCQFVSFGLPMVSVEDNSASYPPPFP